MMKETIAHLEAQGLRSDVRIIVGGAPVNRGGGGGGWGGGGGVAKVIGADDDAPDARGAVKLAKSLLMSQQPA